MKCHQRIIREKLLEEDIKRMPFDINNLSASDFELNIEKKSDEVVNFIKRYEWLGTIGTVPKWVFTARYRGFLGGVVMITEPNAYSKILGPDTKKYEALIQRGACASWTPKNLGSRLIMFGCRHLVKNTDKRLFVAYSDPEANEIGTIYQSCNFDYLGNKFGSSRYYKHPTFKKGKEFSRQVLNRTSTLKKWCRENNIPMDKSWFKENGFKDLKAIPDYIIDSWRMWGKSILAESEVIKKPPKGKYALVLGGNKREQRFLNSLKNYKTFEYPKRD